MDCLDAIRAVRMNLFTTAFLTQYGLCTSSRLGNFQDTHIQKWSIRKRPFASLYVKLSETVGLQISRKKRGGTRGKAYLWGTTTLCVDINVSMIQPLSSSSPYLKDDAVYWHLPAQRITRRRQSWSSNVIGIWVGGQCRLPTSQQDNIYNYSLYSTLQVNIVVLDTGFSTMPPTTSMNVVCTKHTSEGRSVCRRMVHQADSGCKMQSQTLAQKPLGFHWLMFISRVQNASLSAHSVYIFLYQSLLRTSAEFTYKYSRDECKARGWIKNSIALSVSSRTVAGSVKAHVCWLCKHLWLRQQVVSSVRFQY